MTTTNEILDALLEYRTGFPGLRWNFPAVVGTASIDSGAGIGQGVSLTYSFPATLPAYDDPLEFADYTPLDAAQKTAARAVFQHYANVTNITFTESPTTGNGNIAIGQYLNGFPGGGTVGFAEYPAFQSTEESPPPLVTSVAEAGGGTSGDVWLKTGWAADSEYLPGGGGYEVLLHEIGHAMGLKHPFAELVGDAVLPAALDNTGFTVMSYTRIDHTILVTVAPNGLSWSANNNLNPRTLMVGDMLALQTTYGANTSYRNGNDIYTWQPGERFLETIWDGGGIDTLDAASQTLSSVISLVPGTYSSIGLRQSHADFMAGIPLALQPSISQSFSDAVLYNGADNLGIAYGANIENARGGSGNDRITGNLLANMLTGNAGNDTLDGGSGTDTLMGGIGDDTYIVDSITDTLTENLNDGTDTVESSVTFILGSNIENLTLTGLLAINGTGNGANNTITGNGADNVLNGGAGTDTLIGGAGNDTYVVDSITDTFTENVNEGADTVQSSVSFTLGANIENLTLTGNLAINGSGNGANNIITGNGVNNTLDGGGGIDTLAGGVGNDTYIVDSTTDSLTENVNEGNDTVQSSVTFALGANIENLTLTGTAGLALTGNTGNNLLTGNAGNNTIAGNAGNDTLDGGAGLDRANFSGNRNAYTVTYDQPNNRFSVAGPDGSDFVRNVEVLQFADSMTVLASPASNAGIVDNFNAYRYLASNPGLIGVFGTDTEAALNHYLGFGFAENRPTAAFSAYQYMASNIALIPFYGNDPNAAIEHYVRFGFGEGRASSSFDALRYLASNPTLINTLGFGTEAIDTHYVQTGFNQQLQSASFNGYRYLDSNLGLLAVFGPNAAAATDQYLHFGYTEGRSATSFDPYLYLASNPALIAPLAASADAASEHYAKFGQPENRPTTSFSVNQYLATNQTLIPFFTGNSAAAIQHFVNFGYAENRPANGFFGQLYLASNPTLIDTIGHTLEATATHYVQTGFAQNLQVEGFNPLQYLASNLGLLNVFGPDAFAAINHYIDFGFHEGRPANTFDGLEYIASNPGLIAVFGTNADAGIAHYVYNGLAEGRPTISFNAQQYHDNYGDLEGKTQGEARTDFISGGLAQGRTDAVVPLSAGATSGADALNGTGGADTLSSGPGNDTLSGGLGNDTLTGGFGADEFVFNTTLGAGNLDRVVDFTHAMDKLMLENAIFAQLGNAGALDASQFVSNVTGVAVDTNDYLVYNNVTGVLSYDADGSAAGAALAFATLASHPALTAADFTVI